MAQKPKPCHRDKATGRRMLRTHIRDCNANTCDGCEPCPEIHCAICHRSHLDDWHPNTCLGCVGSIRRDLQAIVALCRQLRDQAANAGADGRLAAAAPIPGSVAMVLLSPHAGHQPRAGAPVDDHRLASDPVPPLLVLAGWEDVWREWLEQPTDLKARVPRAVDYLSEHLAAMAQAVEPREAGEQLEIPPDFIQFAHDVAGLRTSLENVLHDERAPEQGVACFECGTSLVRRHRDVVPCDCPPRPTPADHAVHRPNRCCLLCHRGGEDAWDEIHAGHSQGGIDDPRPGMSWECPSCRLEYGPGEYVNAIRQSLLDETDLDGWTTVEHAAIAAEVLAERPISAKLIREWAAGRTRSRVNLKGETIIYVVRQIKVKSVCRWEPGRKWGQRLVFWPDVADVVTRSMHSPGQVA